jgi:pimeloyl-ACP methyl ester carboxylesterase
VSADRLPLYEPPFEETERPVPSSDGVTARAYDWGGDGPPLVFAHATGLHAHCYAPLAHRLRDRFHCYAIDVRGQGKATAPASGDFGWDGLADDFSNALDLLALSGRGDVYGVGHSQGGGMVMMAEGRRPGTFRAIYGFEPVVFPPAFDSTQGDNFMAAAARRRREVFGSREEAYENYRAKPPLNGIDDECLRAYVEYGFEDLDDGTVRLRCRGENEARIFESARSSSTDVCANVHCPTTVALSEHTNLGFMTFVPLQAEALPHGHLVHMAGRSHFGLLERIDEMAEIIATTFLEPERRAP